MRRTAMSLVLFAVMVLLSRPASERAAADDPGGNKELSWDQANPNNPTEIKGLIGTATSSCLEANKCYRWDVPYNNWLYRGFVAAKFYDFGYCVQPPPEAKCPSCTRYPTLECADVELYETVQGQVCMKRGPPRPVYVKNVCEKPPPPPPPGGPPLADCQPHD